MLNPYADCAYADAYHAGMGRGEWAELAPVQKHHALTQATAAIDMGRYRGGHPDGQEHKFPRISDGENVPDAVKRACCEEAYARACDKAAAKRRARAVNGVTSESIGDVSVSYGNAGSVASGASAGALWSDMASCYLLPWRIGSVSIS